MANDANVQRSAFLPGEGDAYFRRNPLNMDQQLANPWNHRIAQILSGDHGMLEIGCADGRRLAAIREISGSKVSFCGVDPSSEAIAAGNKLFEGLDLRVGTADETGFKETFDLVLFGFCLYLVDRLALFAAVAEADQLLKDGGFLGIIDFNPPFPMKRRYHHLYGLWSYKMDYSDLFLASPSYTLVEKHELNAGSGPDIRRQEGLGDRVGLWILRKSESDGYTVPQ